MKNLKLKLHYKSILPLRRNPALLIVALILMGCKSEVDQPVDALNSSSNLQSSFDSSKWAIRQGKDYPYRKSMLSTLVYTDTLRKLNRTELFEVLGTPDRDSEGHMYYLIDQNRLGPWPLNSQFLVIKLTPEETVEWIKIHE